MVTLAGDSDTVGDEPTPVDTGVAESVPVDTAGEAVTFEAAGTPLSLGTSEADTSGLAPKVLFAVGCGAAELDSVTLDETATGGGDPVGSLTERVLEDSANEAVERIGDSVTDIGVGTGSPTETPVAFRAVGRAATIVG